MRRAGSFFSVPRADRAPSEGDGEARDQRLSANLAECMRNGWSRFRARRARRRRSSSGHGSSCVSFIAMLTRCFKTAADTTESAFTYYENAVSRPSRKYTLDLNKKVIDTVISA